MPQPPSNNSDFYLNNSYGSAQKQNNNKLSAGAYK